VEAPEDGAEHRAGQRAAADGSCASSVLKMAGAATNPSTASPPTQSASTTSDVTRNHAIRSIIAQVDLHATVQ
jgi:hypothetical protein